MIFILCLLTVPLFIGNSMRQPAWQLGLSVIVWIIMIVLMQKFGGEFAPQAVYGDMAMLLSFGTILVIGIAPISYPLVQTT